MKEIGIYVHIPFCVKKCKYCNFNSYDNMLDYQNDYLVALTNEIQSYSDNAEDCTVTTVFIGGGTPSLLTNGAISTIMAVLKRNYNISKSAEITIESNPNSITLDKAYEWHRCGINRVSVGLQSSKNNLLKLIGRVHDKVDYVNAMSVLHTAGFENINTDIMIGLPAQKQSDVRSTLNLAVKLGSTHISAYSLILEEDTTLYEEVNSGRVKLPKEEKVVSMYDYTCKYLAKCGLYRYEVSNFARPGRECRHNLNCWSMKEYLGFGAGAHSFFDGVRYSNFDHIPEYIKGVEDGSAVETREKLSKSELLEESIMLGLRKVEGVKLGFIKKHFGVDLMMTKNDVITKYIDLGLLRLENDYLSATDEGFKVLNKIILDIVY